MGGSQAFGAPIAGYLGTKMPIKSVTQIGCCILIFAFFFLGPSTWFNEALPDKIYIIFIGLFLMGFCTALMYVLVTPEIIDASGTQLKDEMAE